MSQPTARLFVAVELGPEARVRSAAVASDLRRRCSGALEARFTSSSNFHFTLKFLGSVATDRVPEIVECLSPIAQIEPFEICLEGVSAFPGTQKPKILWLGVTKGGAALKTLAEQVDRCLGDRGFAPETREFKPHLTLARVKRAPNFDPAVLHAVSPNRAGTSRVTEVVLFRSDLGPSGANYTPLARVALGDTAKERA